MIAGFASWTKNIYRRVRRVNDYVRTPENSALTSKQQETGRKALKILGIDEEAGMGKHDMIIFLYAVGLNPTDDVIDSKLRAFKLHDLDLFTFGHVCHIWQSMLQDLTDEEEILRRAFQFFDKDGNGEISIPELRTTMHELGDLLSEEEILAFMAVMDVNNDGVIGFEEFIGTLKTQTPELINGEDEDENKDDHSIENNYHSSVEVKNPELNNAQGSLELIPAKHGGPIGESSSQTFSSCESLSGRGISSRGTATLEHQGASDNEMSPRSWTVPAASKSSSTSIRVATPSSLQGTVNTCENECEK